MLCKAIYLYRMRQWLCLPLDEELSILDEFRRKRKAEFSALALQGRNEILPDYKIQDALMGIYDDAVAVVYKKTIEAFRKEYHRLQGVIDETISLDELDKIKAKFPKTVQKRK